MILTQFKESKYEDKLKEWKYEKESIASYMMR
jgi:hypothetical protein